MGNRQVRLDLLAGAASVAILSFIAGAPAAFAQEGTKAEEPATLDAVVDRKSTRLNSSHT
jgi:hypothetical protein